MRVAALGPILVEREDGPRDLGGRKERVALAALALNAGRPMSLDELADALWGDVVPPTARRSLQSHLSRLRRALGDPSIVRDDAGYVLAEPLELDVRDFEGHLSAGTDALAHDRLTDALDRLRQAEALWRSTPFPELADWPAAAPEIQRLLELRRVLDEGLIAARLGVEPAAAVVADIERLVADDELREHRWVLLMRGLHLGGRQSDALRAAQRYRTLLATEVGISPGAELLEMEAEILADDRGPDPTGRPVEGPAKADTRRFRIPIDASLPMVGREWARLGYRASWEKASPGSPRALLVGGEPGIGKTRLLADLAEDLADEDTLVLYGRCDPELGAPFQPVVEAMTQWLDTGRRSADDLGHGGRELVRLLPSLPDRIPGLPPPTESDAATERYRLFQAVVSWVTTTTVRRPFVLMADDLHWASAPTLQLLGHILRRVVDGRFLLVAAHRDTDLADGPLAGWLAEVGAMRGVGSDVIALDGLTVDAVDELLQFGASDVAEPMTAPSLHHLTGGNPFYVGEVLAERSRHADSPDPVPLPSSLRDLTALRILSRSASCRRLLEVAAIAGPPCSFRLLEAVADPSVDVGTDVDEAVASGLLVEDPAAPMTFDFRHALSRDAVLGHLGSARRAALHERAAIALSEHPELTTDRTPEDLARHLAGAAGLGLAQAAAAAAVVAGHRALERSADEVARTWFEQALTHAGPGAGAERVDALIGLGEAERRLGDPSHIGTLDEAFVLAAERRDGPSMGRALLTLDRGTFTHAFEVDDRLVERIGAALAQISDQDPAMTARLTARLGTELAWHPAHQRSLDAAERARVQAQALEDPATLAYVLCQRQWTVFHPLSDRLSTTDDLERLADDLDDPGLEFEAASHGVFTAVRSGDEIALRRRLARARTLGAELGQPLRLWMLHLREHQIAVMEGRFDDALAHAESCRRYGQATEQPDAAGQYAVQRFWVAYETAPRSWAEKTARAGAAFWDGLPTYTWPPTLLLCAEVDLREEATDLLAAMKAVSPSELPQDQVRLWTLCVLTEVAAWSHDGPWLEQLASALADHGAEHANVVFATMGSVARYLGLAAASLGTRYEAIAHLERAVRANDDLGAVTWAARSRLDLAEARRAGGDEAVASVLVAEVATTARRLGLPRLADRARALA